MTVSPFWVSRFNPLVIVMDFHQSTLKCRGRAWQCSFVISVMLRGKTSLVSKPRRHHRDWVTGTPGPVKSSRMIQLLRREITIRSVLGQNKGFFGVLFHSEWPWFTCNCVVLSTGQKLHLTTSDALRSRERDARRLNGKLNVKKTTLGPSPLAW
jgi:hypothetical protein